MIQRIQSVFLFLAALLNLSVFLVPVWTYTEGSSKEQITALDSTAIAESGSDKVVSFLDTPMNLIPAALAVLGALLVLFIIFQYKNRKRQVSLSNIAVILIMLHIAAWVFVTMQGPFQIGSAVGEGAPWIGFAFPVVALVLVWLGRSFIIKDEKLVRSSERFR
jgi:glucan phosphoethanolaminetransferase (alkaline phosphatase superfamily)